MNLIKHLAILDHKNEYLIILRKKYFNQLNFPSNFHQILFDFRHYSFREQIYLPRLLHKYKADLIHFPHFNVPIFFRGKFIVTIHDMLMHQYRGLESSTLTPPLYLAKRVAYNVVFNHAVKNSSKIIVPSNYIKQELLRSYKIPQDKVKVSYEGINGIYVNEINNDEILKKYKIDGP
ncbi:MAG: glycosyltransferase, partial [Nanoarchaeota archaeon]